MQYDAKMPQTYLESLDEDWRKKTLLQLREMVLNASEDISEYMDYGMLNFAVDNKPVFALNAQKGYVSFYVGNIEKIDPHRSMLAGLNCGKGCIRFSKSKDPVKINFQVFIDKAISLCEQGVDIGC